MNSLSMSVKLTGVGDDAGTLFQNRPPGVVAVGGARLKQFPQLTDNGVAATRTVKVGAVHRRLVINDSAAANHRTSQTRISGTVGAIWWTREWRCTEQAFFVKGLHVEKLPTREILNNNTTSVEFVKIITRVHCVLSTCCVIWLFVVDLCNHR